MANYFLSKEVKVFPCSYRGRYPLGCTVVSGGEYSQYCAFYEYEAQTEGGTTKTIFETQFDLPQDSTSFTICLEDAFSKLTEPDLVVYILQDETWNVISQGSIETGKRCYSYDASDVGAKIKVEIIYDQGVELPRNSSFFDPESRLMTEYNYTHLHGVIAGKESYIVNWVDDILRVVIAGYYFEINLSELPYNLKLFVNLRETPLVSGEVDSARSTKYLASFDGTPTMLDQVLKSGQESSFTGLYYTTGTEEPKSPYTHCLRVTDEAGNINHDDYLPELGQIFAGGEAATHAIRLNVGNTASAENTVAFGEGTTASVKNQTVVGRYNAEDNNALFIVGSGESSSKLSNALSVSDSEIKVGPKLTVAETGLIATAEETAVGTKLVVAGTGLTATEDSTSITNKLIVGGDTLVAEKSGSGAAVTKTVAIKDKLIVAGTGLNVTEDVTSVGTKLEVAKTGLTADLDGISVANGGLTAKSNETKVSTKLTVASGGLIADSAGATVKALSVKASKTAKETLKLQDGLIQFYQEVSKDSPENAAQRELKDIVNYNDNDYTQALNISGGIRGDYYDDSSSKYEYPIIAPLFVNSAFTNEGSVTGWPNDWGLRQAKMHSAALNTLNNNCYSFNNSEKDTVRDDRTNFTKTFVSMLGGSYIPSQTEEKELGVTGAFGYFTDSSTSEEHRGYGAAMTMTYYCKSTDSSTGKYIPGVFVNFLGAYHNEYETAADNLSSEEKAKLAREFAPAVTRIYVDELYARDSLVIATNQAKNTKGFTFSNEGNFVAPQNIQAQTFTATSDRRLKENLRELCIKKSILDLPTYKFDFVDGTKDNIGCMAQDLQEICPELVHVSEDGYLSIEESKLVFLLLEEVKKLRKEMDELKKA